MTAYAYTKLACDGILLTGLRAVLLGVPPGSPCPSVFDVGAPTFAASRAEAGGLGWTHHKRFGLDLCPTCSARLAATSDTD